MRRYSESLQRHWDHAPNTAEGVRKILKAALCISGSSSKPRCTMFSSDKAKSRGSKTMMSPPGQDRDTVVGMQASSPEANDYTAAWIQQQNRLDKYYIIYQLTLSLQIYRRALHKPSTTNFIPSFLFPPPSAAAIY